MKKKIIQVKASQDSTYEPEGKLLSYQKQLSEDVSDNLLAVLILQKMHRKRIMLTPKSCSFHSDCFHGVNLNLFKFQRRLTHQR